MPRTPSALEQLINALNSATESSNGNRSQASSLTEGVFQHPKDLFTKERIQLMHKQIDLVTSYDSNASIFSDANDESRAVFFLLLMTIRNIILGCFSPASNKILHIFASLPALIEPKRISNLNQKIKSVLDSVIVVLQMKEQTLDTSELMKKYDTMTEFPPLPESYKGILTAKHHHLLHSELDQYIQWARDSFMFKKNNHESSRVLGKLFYKIIKRTICAHLNCNDDLWLGFITGSKKSELSLRDKNPNQNISNYAFLRGVLMNGYCNKRNRFGKSDPIVVSNH